jgi:nicotinamide-nucleotide amidase
VTDSAEEHARRIAELAREHDRSVATVESLTSGRVAAALGAAPGAATWFRGGLVAYHDEVKHSVLGVDPGPVVSDAAARQMAEGVARLLAADVAVATTGSGGPDAQDGHPPGTVFIAVRIDDAVSCHELALDGEPDEVVEASTLAGLVLLREAMESGR